MPKHRDKGRSTGRTSDGSTGRSSGRSGSRNEGRAASRGSPSRNAASRAEAEHVERTPRRRRLGEELRHALAELIERGDMRDPQLRGVPITVTMVDVSPDLRNALAFIVPLGGEDGEKKLAAMRRAAPYFRARLAHMVNMRFAPELRFELDHSFDHASHIEKLLRQPEVARDLDRGKTGDDDEEV